MFQTTHLSENLFCINTFLQVVLNLNEDEVNYSENYIDSDIMFFDIIITQIIMKKKCSKLKTILDDCKTCRL